MYLFDISQIYCFKKRWLFFDCIMINLSHRGVIQLVKIAFIYLCIKQSFKLFKVTFIVCVLFLRMLDQHCWYYQLSYSLAIHRHVFYYHFSFTTLHYFYLSLPVNRAFFLINFLFLYSKRIRHLESKNYIN